MNKTRDDAVIVARGGVASCNINMGSCQCGDHGGTVSLRDGVPWARCSGLMRWQNYDGPAALCRVSYGFGTWAQEVARLVAEGDPLASARLEREQLLCRVRDIDALLA